MQAVLAREAAASASGLEPIEEEEDDETDDEEDERAGPGKAGGRDDEASSGPGSSEGGLDEYDRGGGRGLADEQAADDEFEREYASVLQVRGRAAAMGQGAALRCRPRARMHAPAAGAVVAWQ